MSAGSTPRASDLAAQQVEQIVSAAQAAAEEIREAARLEQQDIRRAAQRDGEEAVEKARGAAESVLARAREEAIVLERDARESAKAMLEDATEEERELRAKTQRAVDGRVAAAERAAAEVLEEARALSGGLQHLGKSLEEHAGRILRDVQAAHKRMQADLRVGAGPSEGDLPVGLDDELGPSSYQPKSAPARRAAAKKSGSAEAAPISESRGARKRPNPIEELEVPSWVGRED